MPGLSGSQDAEGMHLILRREDEAHRGAGRRRRAAETTTAQPDSPGLAAGPGQAPLGKHMTPARPTARSPQGANAAGQGTTGPGQGATAAGPAQAGPGAARAGSGTAQTQAGPAQAGPGAAQTLADARDRANVFAFCGGEAGALAHRLDVIAASATELSDAEVHELARQLAIGARGASEETSPLRIALTAATPGRLAAQAQYAARLLRTGGPVTPAEPGVHISAGATGRVMVVFPGRAESAAAHTALLSVSLEALAALDVLGVKPVIGVGYGLGEIAGLVWAGSLPAAEAARLIAQCGRVLKACACGPAAMARITGNAEVTRALCAPDRLNIAVYEGPGAHVLTGSTAGIRELARRAGALGLPVEILDATSDMHSPAMAGCVAPLRDVFAGTRAAAPQRRLISTITGQLLTAADDIAELLARQVSLPVLFAQALTQAAQEADLVVIAGPDASLAATTAACCALPAVAIPAPTPAGFTDAASAQAVAALFAAGAITDVGPFLATSRSADTLASRTVPRMRTAEPPARHAPRTVPDPEGQEDDAADRRTAVRSGN
jgi:enediyne polyketide synthase